MGWRAPRGDQSLLLTEESVRGVLVNPRVSSVPAAPAWMLGACAFEGRAVSVIDLVVLVDGGVGQADAPYVVLLTTSAGLVGIATDGPPAKQAPDEVNPARRTLSVDVGSLPERVTVALSACGALPRG